MTVTTRATVNGNRRNMGQLHPDSKARRPRTKHTGGSALATTVLLLGALYCITPVIWVLAASSKTSRELFTTFSFAPGTGFIENLVDLSQYGGGQFWQWGINSALYAGGGAMVSTIVSAMAGYALAKFRFRGRETFFSVILAGVLVPGIVLAVPQYLLLANIGLAGTYWSVLLPVIINPFGIFLCRVFASAAVPDETLEAARIDGAGEIRIFGLIALPMMTQGLVTVFLLQFVSIWNNFLLPFIMLSDQEKYPITLGLYTFLAKGAGDSDLYALVIMGSAVSVIPLILLLLVLQRFWRADLLAGGLKG